MSLAETPSATAEDTFGIDPAIYHRRWLILGTLCISLVMIVVAVSSLNVAIPRIQESLGASGTELQWIIDAYACMREKLPQIETDHLAADLTAGYLHLVQVLGDSEWGRMLPAMLDATFRDPALKPLLQAFTDARRQPTRDLLARAIERGDLPADVDVERLIDRIAGPIFYRFLVLQQPYGPDDVAALVADVLRQPVTTAN